MWVQQQLSPCLGPSGTGCGERGPEAPQGPRGVYGRRKAVMGGENPSPLTGSAGLAGLVSDVQQTYWCQRFVRDKSLSYKQ